MDRLPDVYTVPVNNQNEEESMDSTCSIPILPTDTSSEDSNHKSNDRRWNRDNIFPKVVQEYSVDKLSMSALQMRYRGLIENDNVTTSVPCSTPLVLKKTPRTLITPINCSPITKSPIKKKRASRSLMDNPFSKNKRNSNIRGNIVINNRRHNKSLHVNNIENCNVESDRIKKSIAINTTLKRDRLEQPPRIITRLTRTTATNTSAPINNIMLPPPAKELSNNGEELSMKNPSIYEASAEETIKAIKDVRSKKLRKKVKAKYDEVDSNLATSSKRKKTVQREEFNVDNLNIYETPSLITSGAQKSLQRNIVKTNLFQNRTRSTTDIDEVPKEALNCTKNNSKDDNYQINTRTRNKSAIIDANGITESSSTMLLERSRRKVKLREGNVIYLLQNITVSPKNVKAKKPKVNKARAFNELDNELEELRKLYKTPHEDVVKLAVNECINSVEHELINPMDKKNQVGIDEEIESDLPVSRKTRKSKSNTIAKHDIAVGESADERINSVMSELIDSMSNLIAMRNNEENVTRKMKTNSIAKQDIAVGEASDEPINSVVDERLNSMDNKNRMGNDEETASDIPVSKKNKKTKTKLSAIHDDIAVGLATDKRINSENIAVDIPVKRKRGRPRIHPLPTKDVCVPESSKSVEKVSNKNIPKTKATKASKNIDNVQNKNVTKQNPSETKKASTKTKRKQMDDMPPEANVNAVHVENDKTPVGDSLSLGKRIRKPPKLNSIQIIYVNQRSTNKTTAKKKKEKEKVLPKSKKVNSVKTVDNIQDTMSMNILNDDEPVNFSKSNSSKPKGFKVPKGKNIPKASTQNENVKAAPSSISESDAGTTVTNILTCDEVNVMRSGDNETMTSNLGISRPGRRKSQFNNTPFTLPGSNFLIEWISKEPEFKKLGNNLSAPTLRTNSLSFGHFKIMPKNMKSTSIAHKSNLSFIILEGEVLVHVYTRTALLGKNTRFYIPAGVEYCLENVSEDQTAWLEYTKESCSSVK